MNDQPQERQSTSAILAKLGMVVSLISFMGLLLFNSQFGLILPILPESIWPATTRYSMMTVLILLPAGFILSGIGLLGLVGHWKGGVLAPGITGLVVSVLVGIPMSAIVIHRSGQIKAEAQSSAPAPVPAVAQAAAAARAAAGSQAVNVFIPAMDRADMVHDPKRNLLYITAGDSVLRYQMSSNTFLAPLALGGDLRGIDLAPGNDLLAVADATDKNGIGCLHLVDLNAGTNARVTFRLDSLEGGSYSVAFGADGCVWFTSSFHGSGHVPLRKYNPAGQHMLEIKSVSQDTMLSASADRQNIAFAEANSSAGLYGRLSCQATQLPKPLQAMSFLFEVGISRDGTQLAVPTYQKVIISGSAVQSLDERDVIGVAYHPQRDFVFLTWGGTSTVAVYETATYQKVKELDFGDKFQPINKGFQSGRLRVSSDGTLVFCTVNGGVRYAKTEL